MVTQPVLDPVTAASPAGLTAVMTAINNCQTVLTNKIEQLQTDIGLLYCDLDGFWDWMAMAEQRVEMLTPLETTMAPCIP